MAYFPAGTSALKAAGVTAAGKDTAADSATAVAVGEQLVAFLAFAADYLQTYWRAPLVPSNSLMSSVKFQIYSAHWYSGQQHLG